MIHKKTVSTYKNNVVNTDMYFESGSLMKKFNKLLTKYSIKAHEGQHKSS
jgi:hypothetical protein